MFTLGVPWYQLVVRVAVIFAVLLFSLRIFGKREVGQFTLFDLAFVLLVANAVQPAMTGPDNSLTGGVIIIVVLVALNWLAGQLRERVPGMRRLLESAPTTIAKDGKWIAAAMAREGLDQEDCEMALREHGLDDITKVKLVVLEGDGNISVVPLDADPSRRSTRRKVRFVRR